MCVLLLGYAVFSCFVLYVVMGKGDNVFFLVGACFFSVCCGPWFCCCLFCFMIYVVKINIVREDGGKCFSIGDGLGR